jgi:hypothetical protein
VGFLSARLVLFADGCGQDRRREPYHHFGKLAKICYPPSGNAGHITNARNAVLTLPPPRYLGLPTFDTHLTWDGRILPPQANRYSQEVRRYFVAELGPVAPVPSRPAALRNARTLSIIDGAEIFAVAVRGAAVTTRDVGPTHGGDCGSLALSPHGTLYSMCGSLFGAWLWERGEQEYERHERARDEDRRQTAVR